MIFVFSGIRKADRFSLIIFHLLIFIHSVSRIGNFKYLQQKLAAEKEAFLAILKDLKSFYAKGQSLLTAYKSAKSADREWDDTASL